MMVALETLYKDAGEADVQLGILRVVLQILQRHGVPPAGIQHGHLRRCPGCHPHIALIAAAAIQCTDII